MKILITAYDFFPNSGGVATYSWELANSLHYQGHDVLVLTRDQGAAIEAPFKIKMIALPRTGILSIPGLCFELSRTLKSFAPDKVINTLWLPGGVSTYLTLKWSQKKIPYFIIVHAMEIIESGKGWKKRIRKKLKPLKIKVFSGAQKVFCISRFSRELTVQETLCSPEKTIIIHNGVNPESFKQDSQVFKSASPSILSVCRLLPHKGIDEVLKALPSVIQKIPNLQYHIIGSGPDELRLKSLCSDLQLDGHVQFLGHVETDLLNKYYSQAHLFVLLSRQHLHHVEGFGLVFLEAAMCKTPSLGGNSGGVPDAIIENKTGWLIDPTDQAIISHTLIKLLHDTETLKQVGQFAFHYTLENRTWAHVTKNMLQEMDAI